MEQRLGFCCGGVLIAVLICGPFALLSAWNRKKFGKLICVPDDKGLYYRDRVISGMRYVYETRFIPWTDIMSMKYRVPVGLSPNRVTVYCHSGVTRTIDHAPRYLFVRAKKYKPALITTDALAAWVAVVGIPVLAAVMSFVVPNLNK